MNELDAIYDRITEGIRIRSKCDWNKRSEKTVISFWVHKNNDELKTQLKNLHLECIMEFYESPF